MRPSQPDTLGLLPRLLRENLGTLDRRILQLSDWIERDRREPDKLLIYVHELREAVYAAERIRHG